MLSVLQISPLDLFNLAWFRLFFGTTKLFFFGGPNNLSMTFRQQANLSVPDSFPNKVHCLEIVTHGFFNITCLLVATH